VQNYTETFSFQKIREVFENLITYAPLKFVFSSLAVGLHLLFGAELTTLGMLGIVVAVDTLTGVAKAAHKHELSSQGIFRIMTKVLVYLSLLIASRAADRVFPVCFAFTAMSAFLALTELVSVMENIAELGWPVPTSLLNKLKVMQSKPETPVANPPPPVVR